MINYDICSNNYPTYKVNTNSLTRWAFVENSDEICKTFIHRRMDKESVTQLVSILVKDITDNFDRQIINSIRYNQANFNWDIT